MTIQKYVVNGKKQSVNGQKQVAGAYWETHSLATLLIRKNCY